MYGRRDTQSGDDCLDRVGNMFAIKERGTCKGLPGKLLERRKKETLTPNLLEALC